MVQNMDVGNVKGYCMGEPWNARAVAKGIGFTCLATQDLWDNHPEKALVVNQALAETRIPSRMLWLRCSMLPKMQFFQDGKVSFPRRGHGVWFLSQYVRMGLLKEEPPYQEELADELILTDLYAEMATSAGIKVPADDMRPSPSRSTRSRSIPRSPPRKGFVHDRCRRPSCGEVRCGRPAVSHTKPFGTCSAYPLVW